MNTTTCIVYTHVRRSSQLEERKYITDYFNKLYSSTYNLQSTIYHLGKPETTAHHAMYNLPFTMANGKFSVEYKMSKCCSWDITEYRFIFLGFFLCIISSLWKINDQFHVNHKCSKMFILQNFIEWESNGFSTYEHFSKKAQDSREN